MIYNKIHGLEFCPYISTEETMFDLLERDRDQISDDYELINLPLAHLINNIGIEATNMVISETKSKVRRVFVCQHIHVPNLNFKRSDVIFSPHASIDNRFISIPHYAVSQDKSLISESKEMAFSFIGSVTTHPTRRRIVELYDTCYNSGEHWGLENNDTAFKNKYIETLGNSIFSLCPRGTGISSVRTFESMSMGSFPVFIADGYEPPMKDVVDWDRMSVSIPENSLDKIESILTNTKLDHDYMTETYEKYFSNENLHKTIINELK